MDTDTIARRYFATLCTIAACIAALSPFIGWSI